MPRPTASATATATRKAKRAAEAASEKRAAAAAKANAKERIFQEQRKLNITEAGAESTFDKSTINTEANLHWIHIPSHDKPVTFQVMNSFQALNIPDVENEKRLQLGNIGTTQFGPRPGKQPTHYFVESLRLDKDWELLVTGMDWLEDGRLAVCTWPGDVFLLSGVTSGDDVRVRRLLSGLNEPMGLLVRDGKLYVSQKPAVVLRSIAFH